MFLQDCYLYSVRLTIWYKLYCVIFQPNNFSNFQNFRMSVGQAIKFSKKVLDFDRKN